MGVETFNYIDSLNTANPTSTDNVSQGDDHLRGIKTTLKNSFPSVSGAVTATHTELNKLDGVTATTAELNYVDGVTSNIQTQLNAKQASTGNIDRNDNDKILLGTSDDLQIFHDGSNSYIIDNGTGNLIVRGVNLDFQSTSGEDYINCTNNGGVTLRYDNSGKLNTTSTGINVGGTITADGLDMDDNHRIKLGTSDDLQIYHDGSHSYIADTGTGRLRLRGNDRVDIYSGDGTRQMAKFVDGAEVTLYYNNASKLTTTADGVDITGTGALKLPVGTTAQQPSSPTAGDLRWNSDDTSAEIYDGSSWGSVGGGGASTTVYAEHANTLSQNLSIASGNNAVSGGPITINSGYSVTVPSGSVWTIV